MRDAIRHLIFDYYADMISTGRLTPGTALPSLADESERFNTSQAAVSKARRNLRRAGLITPGSGPARVTESATGRAIYRDRTRKGW
ncbi:GntR family transcriptional regulator [Streptomyces sp. IBSBF 2950]|uniref:GntR family transcriptional regulator n=1 Tax=Streptomyces sp. IBSBF 2950 TaxID=2903528 RepID=UPI002FDC4044